MGRDKSRPQRTIQTPGTHTPPRHKTASHLLFLEDHMCFLEHHKFIHMDQPKRITAQIAPPTWTGLHSVAATEPRERRPHVSISFLINGRRAHGGIAFLTNGRRPHISIVFLRKGQRPHVSFFLRKGQRPHISILFF